MRTATFLCVALALPISAFGTPPLLPKELEAALLGKVPAVHRDGGNLEISAGSTSVQFKDSEDATYALVGFHQHSMKRMDYFVFQGGSEKHSYFIVNGETGQKVRTEGSPKVSPDGKRYLMVSMDLEAGSVDNLVQVLSSTSFSTEFEKRYAQDDGIGPDEGTWIDNGRIFFLERGMNRVPAKAMLLELKGGKWQGPRETK